MPDTDFDFSKPWKVEGSRDDVAVAETDFDFSKPYEVEPPPEEPETEAALARDPLFPARGSGRPEQPLGSGKDLPPGESAINYAADLAKLVARGASSEGVFMGAEGIYRGGAGTLRAVDSRAAQEARLNDNRAALAAVEAEEKARGFSTPDSDRQKEGIRQEMQMAEIELSRIAQPGTAENLAQSDAGVSAREGVADFLEGSGEEAGRYREGIREALPVPDAVRSSYPGMIAEGVGQLVTIPAYAVPGLGPAISIGQLYQEGYDDAIGSGASPEQADAAARLYAAGAAPIDIIADKLIVGKALKAMKGKVSVRDALKEIGKMFLQEGAAEGSQQLYLNTVAKELAAYDPDREFSEGVFESVIVGGMVGAVATAAAQGAGAVSRKDPAPIDPRVAPVIEKVRETAPLTADALEARARAIAELGAKAPEAESAPEPEYVAPTAEEEIAGLEGLIASEPEGSEVREEAMRRMAELNPDYSRFAPKDPISDELPEPKQEPPTAPLPVPAPQPEGVNTDPARETVGEGTEVGVPVESEIPAVSLPEPDLNVARGTDEAPVAAPVPREQIQRVLYEKMKAGGQEIASHQNAWADKFADAFEAKDADRMASLIAHGRGFNDTTKAAFFELIGQKVPKNIKGIVEEIDRWAGVSPEERAARAAKKKSDFEAEQLRKDTEWAKGAASRIIINYDGNRMTGDLYIEKIISEGYNKLVSRPQGAVQKWVLAGPDGRGHVVKTELLKYARALLQQPAPASELTTSESDAESTRSEEPEANPDEPAGTPAQARTSSSESDEGQGSGEGVQGSDDSAASAGDSGKSRAQRLVGEFEKAHAGLYNGLAVSHVEATVIAGSAGFQTDPSRADIIETDYDRLGESLAYLEKAGVDAEAWLALAIDEELSHLRHYQSAPTVAERFLILDALREEITSEEWKALRILRPSDSDRALMSEALRMIDQHRRLGEYSETVFRKSGKAKLDDALDVVNGLVARRFSSEVEDHFETMDSMVDLPSDATPAKPEKPSAPSADKSLGLNRNRLPLYEDANGVRYVLDSGVKITEAVRLIPTRDGVRVSASHSDPDFQTTEERAASASAQPPAPAAPKPKAKKAISDELKQALDEGFEGLLARLPGSEPQTGIPSEKIGAFIKIANIAIGEGITTPQALAQLLQDNFDGKANKYTQALWDAVGMVRPDLRGTHDWDTIYASISETDADAGTITIGNGKELSEYVAQALASGEKIDRAEMTRLASDTGLESKQADEWAELGIVKAARAIVAKGMPQAETYKALVDLYANQPNLTAKTSESKINQAYSTPAPIAYAASRLADVKPGVRVMDSAAGNGMLLLEVAPENAIVNELDTKRAERLRDLGFEVTGYDATRMPKPENLERVTINPPFGTVLAADGSTLRFPLTGAEGDTTQIDHAIALKALSFLPNDGRAVLILGGKQGNDESRSDKYSSGQQGAFWRYVYENFGVVDHFTIDGELYKKQGAGWPIDIVVIQGRKPTGIRLPSATAPRMISSWDSLANELNRTDSDRIKSLEPDAQRDAAALLGILRGERNAPEQSGDQPPVRSGSVTPENSGPLFGSPGDPGVVGEGAGTIPAGPGSRGTVSTREEGTGPGSDQGVSRDGDSGSPDARPAVESQDLQVPYIPTSEARSLDTLVPVNLKTASEGSLAAIKAKVGSLDTFVTEKLGYPKGTDIGQYFGAEQIDALAAAITNIEAGGAFILGDQTGIGKGRVAAGMIAYANNIGRVPVFLTANKTLYPAMMSDLADIGKGNIRPFFTDNDGVDFVDPSGRQWKSSKSAGKSLASVKDGLPKDSDVIFTTYFQLNMAARGFKETPGQASSRKANKGMRPFDDRAEYFERIASEAVFILDESHIAGGNSEISWRLAKFLGNSAGAYYSSATFAKRPDNIGIYFKTALGSVPGMTPLELTEIMEAGGVPLQQVVSQQLAESGQYLRRERSYDGVVFDTKIDETSAEETIALADQYTSGIRVIQDVSNQMKGVVNQLNKVMRNISSKLGAVGAPKLESTEFGEKIHNFVSQYLLAMKARSAADEAIKAIKEGIVMPDGTRRKFKVVVAVQNTMEGPIKALREKGADLNYNSLLVRSLEDLRTLTSGSFGNKKAVIIGREEPPQFKGVKSEVIQAGLLETYTEQNEEGRLETKTRIVPENATELIRRALNDLLLDAEAKIESLQLGEMPLSPIDYMRHRVEAAGIRTGEITGRSEGIDKNGKVYVRSPKEVSKPGQVRVMNAFNNENLDFIVLNQSGSTGISLHASEKFARRDPRMMIVAQPHLDINQFMQMLGRIHRSGQVELPYFMLLQSSLPAEKRPAAILGKKMARLNANTTSNGKSAVNEGMNAPDVFNQYGDDVTFQYMKDDPQFVAMLQQDKLKGVDSSPTKDAFVAGTFDEPGQLTAYVTGKMAILPVEEQAAFWDRMNERYNSLISYLNEIGQNDLEAEALDIKAETLAKEVFTPATPDGKTSFNEPSYLEKVRALIGRMPESAETALQMGREAAEKYSALKAEHRDAARVEAERLIARAKEKSISEFTKEKEDALKARLKEKYTEIVDGINKIGKTVKIDDGKGLTGFGVVTDVKPSMDTPLTPSDWHFVITINTTKHTLKVPASQFSNIVRDTDADSFAESYEATAERNSERQIITGNLLAAYKRLNGGVQSADEESTTARSRPKVKIITYTTKDGETKTGILLPANGEISAGGPTTTREEITGPTPFVQALRQGSRVESADRRVRFTLKDNRVELRVPSARQAGGSFWRNPTLNAKMEGGKFIEKGAWMVGKVEDVAGTLEFFKSQEVPIYSFTETEAEPPLKAINPKSVISAAQDAEYLAAVERGDMKAAQKMVDNAAVAANYDPITFLHHTFQDFDVFNPGGGKVPHGPAGWSGKGIWLESETVANKRPLKSDLPPIMHNVRAEAAKRGWKKKEEVLEHLKTMRLYVKPLFPLGGTDTEWRESLIPEYGFGKEFPRLVKDSDIAIMKRIGRDAAYILDRDGAVAEMVVFNPNQVKSAETVTRDSEGNIIPLSERFNPDNDSVLRAIDPKLLTGPDRESFSITALVQLLREFSTYPTVNTRLVSAYGRFVGKPMNAVQLRTRLLWDKALARRVLGHEIGHFVDLAIRPEGKGKRFHTRWQPLVNFRKEIELRKVLKDAARALSRDMRGDFDNGDPYRDKPTELFADVMSALLTRPDWTKNTHPLIFGTFQGMMDGKPTFKTAYDDLTNYLRTGELDEKISEQLEDSIGKSIEESAELADPLKTNLSRKLLQWLVSKWHRAGQIERERSISDRKIDKLEDAELFAARMGAIISSELKEKVQPFLDQIAGGGIEARKVFGRWLTANRIVNERRAAGKWLEQNPDEAVELLQSIIDFDSSLEKKWQPQLDALKASPAGEEVYDFAAAMMREVAEKADRSTTYANRFEAMLEELGDVPGGQALLSAFNVRGMLLNPHGLTPETAKAQLESIKADLPPAEFTALQEGARNFFDIVHARMEAARGMGLISADTWTEIVEPNRYNYVPFAVMDYFEGKVGAGMKTQRGTAKDIADPYMAAQLKLGSLHHWMQRQMQVLYLQSIYDKAGMPIIPTRKLKNSADLEKARREHKDDDTSRLTMWQDGQAWLVEFPEDPGKSYESAMERPAFYQDLAAVYNASFTLPKFLPNIGGKEIPVGRIPQYVLQTYTTLSPSFLFFRNAIRSIRTDANRIGWKARMKQAATGMKESYRLASNYAEAAFGGAMLPEIKEMVGSGALPPPQISRSFYHDPALLNEMIINGGITAMQLGARKAVTPFVTWKRLEKLAAILEAQQKIQAYNAALTKSGDKPLSTAVARRAGIPNPGVFGQYSQVFEAIFPWTRVMVQGLRSTVNVARDPELGKGFIARTMITEMVPRIAMFAIASGLISRLISGDDEEDDSPLASLAEFFRRASPYKLAIDNLLPLGWYDPDTGQYYPLTSTFGKKPSEIPQQWQAWSLRLPSSEEGKLWGSLLWNILSGSSEKTAMPGKGVVENVGNWAVGNSVQLSPAFEVANQQFKLWIQGVNPTDSFRNIPVANPDMFEAGGMERAQANAGALFNQFSDLGSLAGTVARMLGLDPRAVDPSRVKPGIPSPLAALPIRAFSFDNYAAYRSSRSESIESEQNSARARMMMSRDVRGLYDFYYKNVGKEDSMTETDRRRFAAARDWKNSVWRDKRSPSSFSQKTLEAAAQKNNRGQVATITRDLETVSQPYVIRFQNAAQGETP